MLLPFVLALYLSWSSICRALKRDWNPLRHKGRHRCNVQCVFAETLRAQIRIVSPRNVSCAVRMAFQIRTHDRLAQGMQRTQVSSKYAQLRHETTWSSFRCLFVIPTGRNHERENQAVYFSERWSWVTNGLSLFKRLQREEFNITTLTVRYTDKGPQVIIHGKPSQLVELHVTCYFGIT